MSRYGDVAVKATLLCQKKGINPINAWKIASETVFEPNSTSLKKTCPKNTFLGLCEEGLIKDIPKGRYTRSVKNKQYALSAVELIKNNPNIEIDKNKLWKYIVGENKKHNSQLDVVFDLYENDMLHIK